MRGITFSEKARRNWGMRELINKNTRIITYIETGYCLDCKKEVDLKVYNADCDPPLMICVDCGQFIYKEDQLDTYEETCENRMVIKKHGEGDWVKVEDAEKLHKKLEATTKMHARACNDIQEYSETIEAQSQEIKVLTKALGIIASDRHYDPIRSAKWVASVIRQERKDLAKEQP